MTFDLLASALEVVCLTGDSFHPPASTVRSRVCDFLFDHLIYGFTGTTCFLFGEIFIVVTMVSRSCLTNVSFVINICVLIYVHLNGWQYVHVLSHV